MERRLAQTADLGFRRSNNGKRNLSKFAGENIKGGN